jgi:hypothetical protein
MRTVGEKTEYIESCKAQTRKDMNKGKNAREFREWELRE